MSDILELDARAQAAAVRDGSISAVELVSAAAQRIEAVDPEINALSWDRLDRALDEAKAVRPGTGTPFAGVPILLKDHRCQAAGHETRFGTAALRDDRRFWARDTNVYRSIVDQGFIVLGRTTSPEFATALVTESVANGVTRNPKAPNRTSSGSSGGSASAVAAGMVAVAHATDGGGSIRCPASACGLVGLKPSRGRVSMGPVEGESWAGATVEGILARTVGDAAAVTAGMNRWFPGDPYVAPGAIPMIAGDAPAGLRIGVMTNAASGSPWGSTEVTGVLSRVADVLTERGHDIEESFPDALRDENWQPDYDAMVSTDVELLARKIERLLGRPLADDELAPRNVDKRRAARSMGATDYLETRYRLSEWTYRLHGWWHGTESRNTGAGFDLLMTPVLGDLPALVGDPADDAGIVARSAGMQPMTAFANVGGLPAISLPLGLNEDGVPIGIQFVGKYGAEGQLISLAADFERRGPWHV